MQSPLFFQKNIRIILLLTAGITFILAFSDILVAIVSQWVGAESAGTNHGSLVLVCTIYLLFIKRNELNTLAPDPQRVGFIALALLSILLFLSELTEIQALQMLLMPLLILSLIFTILGKQYLKMVLVPIVILIFALPIWKPVLPILQDVTTWVTEFNLKILSRPVYVVGNYVYVTGGVFLIEEACSGLRYLLIAIILSLINSDLNSHNMRQSATLLLIAIGLAFLANWVRVIVIVVIGDLTNMQNSLVQDHVNFGWVVFLLVVLIPFLFISRLVPANDFKVDKVDLKESKATYRSYYFLVTMLIIISVSLLRHGHQLILRNSSIEEIEVPVALMDWNGNNNLLADAAWKPDYKNATKELFKSYSESSGVEIDLYISHYAQQKQGAELINAENSIADGKLWSVLPSTEERYLVTNMNAPYRVNTVEIINKSKEKKLVWYWYDIGGYVTSNQYYAKLFQILAQLEGKNYASLIAISIVCEDDCKERQHYLENYVSGWQVIDD